MNEAKIRSDQRAAEYKGSQRELIHNLYIRIAKDSGFKLDYIQISKLVADLLQITPLDVWIAFSDLKTMERIAKGEHPCVKN